MTLKEIKAQFIAAKAEMQRLQDMLDLTEDADEVLCDVKAYIDQANDAMINAKESMLFVVENYDNNLKEREVG